MILNVMSKEISSSGFNIQDKMIFILMLLCFGFIPLFFYPAMMWQYHASKVLLLQIIILIALAIQLYQSRSAERVELAVNKLDIFVTLNPLLFLILLLFLPYYRVLALPINLLFMLTIFYWLMNFLLIRQEPFRLLRIFLWVLLFSCIVESSYGLLQFSGIIPYQGEIIYESVIIGTFGNANSVAGYLAASLPILLGLSILAGTRLQKSLVGIGVVLSVIVIGLTYSRGAWLALSAAMVVFNFPVIKRIWQRIKKKLLRFIILLLTIILAGNVFYVIYHMDQDASKGRIFLWKIATVMIKDYPIFGIGYGNYPVQYLNYQAKFFENPASSIYYDHAANIKEAHNQYLQIFAETGLMGSVIFLSIIFIFFIYCIRILSSEKKGDLWQMTRMFLASGTVIFIHSLFDSPLNDLPIYIIFYFNLAIISVFTKQLGFSSCQLRLNWRKYQSWYMFGYNILFIIYLVLAGLKLFNIVDQVEGYKLWKIGQIQANRHNWNYSIRLYQKALAYIPFEGELHFHLAGAYVMNQEYNKALPEFKMALETFHDKNIYLSRGMAYQQLKNYSLAEKNYQRVIDMFPNLLFPRYLLGKMYYDSGQIKKAENILESILYINPRIYNKDTEVIKGAARELLDTIR
jgi:O-antigen ligase